MTVLSTRSPGATETIQGSGTVDCALQPTQKCIFAIWIAPSGAFRCAILCYRLAGNHFCLAATRRANGTARTKPHARLCILRGKSPSFRRPVVSRFSLRFYEGDGNGEMGPRICVVRPAPSASRAIKSLHAPLSLPLSPHPPTPTLASPWTHARTCGRTTQRSRPRGAHGYYTDKTKPRLRASNVPSRLRGPYQTALK